MEQANWLRLLESGPAAWTLSSGCLSSSLLLLLKAYSYYHSYQRHPVINIVLLFKNLQGLGEFILLIITYFPMYYLEIQNFFFPNKKKKRGGGRWEDGIGRGRSEGSAREKD